jgi:hypothetical protein|tara:strand:- start:448 stop:738 length:291 start_codon:yes stop_codon:yes gene_type:complete
MAGNIKSWFISDRSGFRFKYKDRIKEEGTQYVVGPGESDGRFDLVNHPQNKSPNITGSIVLKDARPDTVLATTGDAGWVPSMTTFVPSSITQFTSS